MPKIRNGASSFRKETLTTETTILNYRESSARKVGTKEG